jgi:hypothetical protein
MKKRGIFFSMDALIAVSIIFITILIAYPLITNVEPTTELQHDIIKTLSSIRIGDLNNSYAQSLVSSGAITDLNKSVLEQIGEFQITDREKAKLLAESTLSDIEPGKNIGIWFGSSLITSRNNTSFETARHIETARQVISGIKEGTNVTGFSARAYLSSSLQSEYFYFGGYVGDGNITSSVVYNGTISSAEMEIAINENFRVYVNGVNVGNYTKPDTELTPKRYIIPTANFHSGYNIVELRTNSSTRLRITGGFIKIDYEKVPEYDKPDRRYISGINGIINVYTGFTVPNTLESMSINLHYKSPYRMFVFVGNTKIYDNSSANGTTAFISNSELSAKLNYAQLSNKTTPVRFGLYAASKAGNADVVVITDLSDSMNSMMNNDSAGVTRNCTDPHLYDSDTKRISVAKCMDKIVVDAILEIPGNRVALAAFYGDESSPNKGRIYQELPSSNATYLKNKINAYVPQGGTCLCCGINDAYKILNEQSNPSRRRYVIVMSDGIPTHTCQAASGCTGTRTGLPSDEGLWLGSSSGCYGGSDDCNVADCNCAVTNVNWSACRANTNLNATLFSIGFGNMSACALADATLRNVAVCGKGKYYTSDNSSILQDFYLNISQEIIDLSYIEQVANATGNLSNTLIYPDSYIELDYDREPVPFGLVATTEKKFDNADYGSFSIPANSSIVKATAISYSGPKWTALVEINNNTIYNLTEYGWDYTALGDPYAIRIPNSFISQDNSVKIARGISPDNITSGSANNKIIYTIVKNASSYTRVCTIASGCIWSIGFDDGTNATIKSPSNYNGTETCSYQELSQYFNENDAYQFAVYNLLKKLDLDSDNKVDIKFTEQSLNIASSEMKGVPYLWSTEIQVRTWAR